MVISGKINLDRIATHTYKIEDFQTAYEMCKSGERAENHHRTLESVKCRGSKLQKNEKGDKNYGNVGKKSENEQAGECKEQ